MSTEFVAVVPDWKYLTPEPPQKPLFADVDESVVDAIKNPFTQKEPGAVAYNPLSGNYVDAAELKPELEIPHQQTGEAEPGVQMIFPIDLPNYTGRLVIVNQEISASELSGIIVRSFDKSGVDCEIRIVENVFSDENVSHGVNIICDSEDGMPEEVMNGIVTTLKEVYFPWIEEKDIKEYIESGLINAENPEVQQNITIRQVIQDKEDQEAKDSENTKVLVGIFTIGVGLYVFYFVYKQVTKKPHEDFYQRPIDPYDKRRTKREYPETGYNDEGLPEWGDFSGRNPHRGRNWRLDRNKKVLSIEQNLNPPKFRYGEPVDVNEVRKREEKKLRGGGRR